MMFFNYAHNNGRKVTRNIANIIKQDTNANVICIELMTTSSAAFQKKSNSLVWSLMKKRLILMLQIIAKMDFV